MTVAFGLEDTHLSGLDHCGRPVKHKSTRYGWSGDFETSTAFFICPECGAELSVALKRDVGPVPA